MINFFLVWNINFFLTWPRPPSKKQHPLHPIKRVTFSTHQHKKMLMCVAVCMHRLVMITFICFLGDNFWFMWKRRVRRVSGCFNRFNIASDITFWLLIFYYLEILIAILKVFKGIIFFSSLVVTGYHELFWYVSIKKLNTYFKYLCT